MENTPKPSPLHAISRLLASFAMTGIAIYSYKYLPQRELLLIPSDDPLSFYLDTTGKSQFQWLDKNNRKFRCTYEEDPSRSRYCGMNVQQGDGLANGIDMSIYSEIDLHVEYTGQANIMRFYMRNFSPEFSTTEDAQNTSKYNNILIPVSELKDHLIINFNEFSIPEWWIRSSGIPRELSHPEFNNITHLGIDISFPMPYGDHDLELKSIRLTGLYLTKDTWYLSILAIWGAALFFIVLRRELHQIHKAKHLKQASDRYKKLSILDALSGVFNRRGIHEFYEHCFKEGSEEQGSIIMLDIDHFKQINDTYGHDAGDTVIQSIGDILRNCIREQDNVGRWGGEEFIILCVNTPQSGATVLAEKIRTRVESYTFNNLPNLTVTVSLGIAAIHNKKGFEENVKLADEAMYKAKQAGRNQWVAAS